MTWAPASAAIALIRGRITPAGRISLIMAARGMSGYSTRNPVDARGTNLSTTIRLGLAQRPNQPA